MVPLFSKKLRIKIKSYDTLLLGESCKKIINTLRETTSKNFFRQNVKGPISLPVKRRKYCLLTSPHVNKKAREHFEIRTHKKIIDLYNPTEQVTQELKKLEFMTGTTLEIKLF